MMYRARLLTACLAITLLAACGKPSATERAISSYSPAEVAMIRAQAQQAGIDLDDELLLSTLRARDDCRILRAALSDYAAGKTEAALAKMGALRDRNVQYGQPDQAEYFRGLGDQLKSGDPSNAQDYLVKNCQGIA